MIKAICDNKKRIIYGIFVIAWMILIFSFSSQNGEESQKTSGYFTDKVVQIISKVKSDIDIGNTEEIVSFIIRKMAHFSIYFVGGILIFNFVGTFPLKLKNVILLTFIIGCVYSISDEIHQLFISERAGQIRDVLIDSAGVMIATFLMGKFKEDKKKIVLAITAILVLIAAIYSFILQTPKYKSTTTVVLTMSEGENATAVTTTDVTLNQKLLGTYVDIVKRDMIIDKVIENLQIANLTSSQLKSDVTVSTKTDTYIIDITVSNENSEYAARIANEIGKVFSEEVSKMYKMNNIYILDSAKVNSTPYNVKPAKYIGIAFIAGIFISCAVIVIMNLFDTTVKSADEIEKALKVPVIAQLAFYDDTIKKGVNKR